WLSSTGPVLGIIPNQDFELLVRPFPPGSRLVIYSDGVTDQRNSRGDSFGPERLLRAVQNAEGKPPRGLIEAVRDELEFFAGDAPQDDDTTIAVLARD
ncbi:MAG: SpoIIE family protein phosphatase, partial [Candidatus Polarisedimenticolia bacterium]